MIGIKMNQVLVVALALTCAAAEPLAKPDVTDGKQELVRVPAYTMWHKDLNVALAELKRHLLRQDVRDNNPNDPFIQYVMIVNVVNQLIDISLGNEFKYNMVFYNVVPAVILETIKNPQDSADKVRVQADRSYAKTSAIRDLIDTKQRKVCKDPNAYACDVIVDIAVQTSGDDLLKRQAHLMQTLSVEFELFLQDYANEFNDVSKDKKAIAYLINGIERLRPLVMIAGKARKESKSTPPIQFRSTGSKPL